MNHHEEFSFDEALGEAQESATHEKFEWYRRELGKFLEPPYTFELPKSAERLPDEYPASYYMCRNGNRTAAAGLIEKFVSDFADVITEPEKTMLQMCHDLIFVKDRDVWRNEDEMFDIKFAIQEAHTVIGEIMERVEVKI